MIDVITGPPGPSFRYRLAGTEIVKMYGFEFTGMTVPEAFPLHADDLTADYADVVVRRRPNYRKYSIPAEGKEHAPVERLTCPLSNDGKSVNMLIGVIGFE